MFTRGAVNAWIFGVVTVLVAFWAQAVRRQLAELARLVERGELRPEVDSTFPLAQAREAFARTTARGKHGKVVLRVVDWL